MATQMAVMELSGRTPRIRGSQAGGWRGSRLRARSRSEAAKTDRLAERQDLLLAMAPLVRRVAFEVRQHLPNHVDMNDLVSAGNLGLVDAMRKFDPARNVKIETYARHRIRGGILDSLRSLDPATRDMRKRARRVEQAYAELEAKLGRPAKDEEIAEALGISLKLWHRWAREIHTLGFDGWRRCETAAPARPPLTKEEAGMAAPAENPFDLCYRREQRDLVNRALARLPERDRLIMVLYYQQDLTMKQIAARLKVDESRISQLHSDALAELKSRVAAALQPSRPKVAWSAAA